MASLFTNSSGYEVKTVSYSSLQEFNHCNRLFQITRILGYKEPDNKAALKFGNVLEAGLIHYHESGLEPGSGIARFLEDWAVFENADLIYTEREGSWRELCSMGAEMLRLYEVLLPTFPIQNPSFQLNFKKSVYTEDHLQDIKFTSFVDIVSNLEEDHPALPPGTRKLIIDVKSAGAPYPSVGRGSILRLDKQLREYVWATGIMDVAFLVFVKTSPNLRRGDRIIILSGVWPQKPGAQATVFSLTEETVMYCHPDVYEEYIEAEKQISGKGSKERKEALAKEYEVKCFSTPRDNVTKQRIQFLSTRMTDEDLQGIGEFVGDQTWKMKQCGDSGEWPQDPGIRWPNNKCVDCRALGICLSDPKLIEERLVSPLSS